MNTLTKTLAWINGIGFALLVGVLLATSNYSYAPMCFGCMVLAEYTLRKKT